MEWFIRPPLNELPPATSFSWMRWWNKRKKRNFSHGLVPPSQKPWQKYFAWPNSCHVCGRRLPHGQIFQSQSCYYHLLWIVVDSATHKGVACAWAGMPITIMTQDTKLILFSYAGRHCDDDINGWLNLIMLQHEVDQVKTTKASQNTETPTANEAKRTAANWSALSAAVFVLETSAGSVIGLSKPNQRSWILQSRYRMLS